MLNGSGMFEPQALELGFSTYHNCKDGTEASQRWCHDLRNNESAVLDQPLKTLLLQTLLVPTV